MIQVQPQLQKLPYIYIYINMYIYIHIYIYIYIYQSINASANQFVFRDLNIHYKAWLIYYGEKNKPRELCYNFSVLNALTQIVHFPTRTLDRDSQSPTLLNLVLSFDPSIRSTWAYFPLGNSDRVVISVSFDFPSNSKGNTYFHCNGFRYSPADQDGLRIFFSFFYRGFLSLDCTGRGRAFF